MIFDRIENINNYGFDLQFVLDDLNKQQFAKGRFDIEGANGFGIGLTYETQAPDKALWEAHQKHLDIHVITEGEEIVSVTDISNATSTKPYEDDYELFTAIPQQRIHLKPGFFLLLFPHEVHRTTEKINGSLTVIKNVYKYPINE